MGIAGIVRRNPWQVLGLMFILGFLTQKLEFTAQPRKSVFDNVVRDCRTWEPIDFKMLQDKAETVAVEDAEKHENRLESWIKDWDSTGGQQNNPSGVGSSVAVTENMRLSLATIVDKLKLELNKNTINFLDSPSGDMTWMPVFLETRTDVKYSGYDLIPQNIAYSKETFTDKDWTFKQWDLMKDRIDTSFDLVLNRHVSIHLGLLDSIQMYHNFAQSGSKYLLTTTYPDVEVNDQLAYSNEEVSGRGFHRVNLHLYPFNFPQPICQNVDAPGQANQHLALWRIDDLVQFFKNNEERFRDFE